MSRSKFCTRSYSSPSSSPVLQPILNSVSPSNRMTKTASNPLPIKPDVSSPKKRINRCKKCKNCLKVNCGLCVACKDMRQFGGRGTGKQSCFTRPKCLNVVIPTMEKRENIKNSVKMEGKKRKHAKMDKNDNIIKAHKISKSYDNCNECNLDEDIIPPYKPRVFPMSDSDFNRMMAEGNDNSGDGKNIDKADDDKSMRAKDIPTRSWRLTGPGRMKMSEASDDFEDTSDEVFKQRHARAAQGDGMQEHQMDDQDLRVGSSENNMDEAGHSTASGEAEDPLFKIPFVSKYLEVKLPDISNFEEDPHLRAILRASKLRSTKVPKTVKEILPGTIKKEEVHGKVLRSRRTSGSQSKAG